MTDEMFIPAFLSMGSSYGALLTSAHAWTTEGEVPVHVHVPGPPIPFDDFCLAPESTVIVPLQKGVIWMDLSLTATSGTININRLFQLLTVIQILSTIPPFRTILLTYVGCQWFSHLLCRHACSLVACRANGRLMVHSLL